MKNPLPVTGLKAKTAVLDNSTEKMLMTGLALIIGLAAVLVFTPKAHADTSCDEVVRPFELKSHKLGH